MHGRVEKKTEPCDPTGSQVVDDDDDFIAKVKDKGDESYPDDHNRDRNPDELETTDPDDDFDRSISPSRRCP